MGVSLAGRIIIAVFFFILNGNFSLNKADIYITIKAALAGGFVAGIGIFLLSFLAPRSPKR